MLDCPVRNIYARKQEITNASQWKIQSVMLHSTKPISEYSTWFETWLCFVHRLGIVIPTDYIIFFQRGIPPTWILFHHFELVKDRFSTGCTVHPVQLPRTKPPSANFLLKLGNKQNKTTCTTGPPKAIWVGTTKTPLVWKQCIYYNMNWWDVDPHRVLTRFASLCKECCHLVRIRHIAGKLLAACSWTFTDDCYWW